MVLALLSDLLQSFRYPDHTAGISPNFSQALGPSCYREEQNRTNSRLLFYLSYYFILALVFVLYLFNAWVASLPSLSISFLASKSAWDWPSQPNGNRSTPTWKRNSKFNHKPLPLQLTVVFLAEGKSGHWETCTCTRCISKSIQRHLRCIPVSLSKACIQQPRV